MAAEKAEKQSFSPVLLILKSVIILFYVFPVWLFGQNNCANPLTLNYSNSFPDYQTYQFSDSLLWFSFTADSVGEAEITLATSITTNGAYLEQFKLFSGSCGSLQLITSKTYSTFDSLSISLSGLLEGTTYRICIERIILNGCSNCNNVIDVCLTSVNSNGGNEPLLNLCSLECFGENLVINGDFSLGNTGFSCPNFSLYNPQLPPPNPTHGTIFIGAHANAFSNHFNSSSGYPSTNPANEFLMCDLHKFTPAGNDGIFWEQSLTNLQVGATYKFSFFALNLDPAGPLNNYSNPRIRVFINNFVIDPVINYVPGSFDFVQIPKDANWHTCCFDWVCTSTNITIEIQNVPWEYQGPDYGFSFGHDVGIDHLSFRKLNTDIVEVQSPVTICEGEYVDLGGYVTIPPPGIGPFNYYWNNQSIPGLTNLVNPLTATTYYLTVVDATMCQKTAEIEVLIEPKPVKLFITGNNNNCQDEPVVYSIIYSDPETFFDWSVDCPPGYSWGSFVGPDQGYGQNTASIVWTQSNFPVPPEYVVLHLSFANACGKFHVFDTIFSCCPKISGQDYVFSDEILLNQTISNDIIVINGEVTMQGTVSFENCDVYMGPMAKITADNNSLFIVEGATSFTTCSEYMWDGIYSDKTTSDVHVLDLSGGSPLITKAIHGVVSTKGGHAFIRSAQFTDNYHSITVSDYYPSSSGYYGLLDFQVNSSDFWVGQQGQQVLLPPYAGVYPDAGIFLYNAEAVIGSENALSNSFVDFQRGIYSLNSDADVVNARFENCPPDILFSNAWPIDQAGILATVNKSKALISLPSLTVQSILQPITFTNCKAGISTFSNRSFVQNCDFTDCEYAVHYLNPFYPSRVLDCEIGKLVPSNIDINGCGISVISANPSTSSLNSKLFIENNLISGIKDGIYCSNQNIGNAQIGNVVENNTIHFLGLAGPFRFGINAERSDGISVWNNIIDYNTWTTVQSIPTRGIEVRRTLGATVRGNYITKLDVGIYTAGECLHTLFYCNTFDNCWNGFFFGPVTGLTDQHVPDNSTPTLFYNTHNRWIGNYVNQGNHYKMTEDIPGNNINLLFNWYYDPAKTDEYKPDFDLINNLGIHTCDLDIDTPEDLDDWPLTACDIVVGSVYLSDLITDSTTRTELLGDILYDNNVYDSLEVQSRFYEKDYLFSFILRHPEVLSLGTIEDAAYQAFLDSVSANDPGLIRMVYKYIEEQKLDSADYFNNLIANTGNWITNRKIVNSLYMQYWGNDNYNISEDDRNTLLAIALQTPYEGGDGVYTARCMLNLFDVASLGTPYHSAISQPQYEILRINPNPASSWFDIELPECPDQRIILELYNMDGRFIESKQLAENVTEYRYRTAGLDNGCYFLRAKTKEKFVGIAKICVIR